MRNERLVDFLFTGAAVVPATLMLGGHLDIAFMVLSPLLIGVCLTAAYLEGTPTNAQHAAVNKHTPIGDTRRPAV